MTNPIKIHGFPLSGHSHRVELFAALANIPFEMITVDLAGGEQRQEAFLKLNPFGQVPVIEDGDVVLSDSNAILVYLAKTYAPNWIPSTPAEEAEVQRFLTMAAGDIGFGPATARLITVFGAPLDPEQAQNIADRGLGRLEAHLTGRNWTVGDQPTIADIALYSYIAHAPEGNVSLEAYPNIKSWLSRIESLSGFVAMPVTKAGLVV
jgi:glutathione S-transferase